MVELRAQKAKATGAVQMTESTNSIPGHATNAGGGFGNAGSAGNAGIQYRDRAKERREKYGAPAPPEPSAKHKAQLPQRPPVP